MDLLETFSLFDTSTIPEELHWSHMEVMAKVSYKGS